MSRTKNASRNILFGIILNVYQMIFSFIMRTALIYFLGVQYLGLSSLFASVIQVLSLAELGVGSAMVFSMYKPVAEQDSNKLCALLKLYKTYYAMIGAVIAVVGVMFVPFVPKLIKGEVPADINVYILYFLDLFATVLSYWLFAYKSSLLQAHQRSDVMSKIRFITNTIQYLLQIIVLWVLHNYYMYVIIALFVQTATNVITAVVASKMYPSYFPAGNIEQEQKKHINKKIKDLFTAKIGYIVNTSVDTVVISAFLGLASLAIYNNYYYIMNSILGVIGIVFNSITAGIGNSLITESKEKNFDDLKKFSFLIFIISTVCCCCFLNLYQPFMQLWVGEELMLSFGHVIAMTVMFFVMTARKVWVVFKDAAGIWREDRWRPLIAAGVNLFLNIVFVRYIGLYGIMISTIVAELVISIPWLLKNLFTHVLPLNSKRYIINIIGYTTFCILCSVMSVMVCNLIRLDPILRIMANGVISCIIPMVMMLLVYRKTEEYSETFLLIKRMIGK